MGYDVARTLEHLPDPPPDDRDLPDALFMVVDTLLVLDNIYNRATVIASVEVPAGADAATLEARFDEAESRIDLWLSRLESPSRVQPLAMDPVAVPASVSPYADDTFRADVARIKEYIAAGDIFQAVLSRRIDLAGAATISHLPVSPRAQPGAVPLLPAV